MEYRYVRRVIVLKFSIAFGDNISGDNIGVMFPHKRWSGINYYNKWPFHWNSMENVGDVNFAECVITKVWWMVDEHWIAGVGWYAIIFVLKL